MEMQSVAGVPVGHAALDKYLVSTEMTALVCVCVCVCMCVWGVCVSVCVFASETHTHTHTHSVFVCVSLSLSLSLSLCSFSSFLPLFFSSPGALAHPPLLRLSGLQRRLFPGPVLSEGQLLQLGNLVGPPQPLRRRPPPHPSHTLTHTRAHTLTHTHAHTCNPDRGPAPPPGDGQADGRGRHGRTQGQPLLSLQTPPAPRHLHTKH